MTRAGFLARLRRLERPRRTQDAMRQELERLERLYPPVTDEQIDTMTDEQLDDLLQDMCSYNSPRTRIFRLREALRTPEERLEQKRIAAEFEAMTDEELDAWLERYRERCRTGG